MNLKIQIYYELYRKLIHLSSSIFSIIYLFYEKTEMLLLLFAIGVFFISWDYLRHYNALINAWFNLFFAKALRIKEKHNHQLTSASFMFLGLIISAVLFNKFVVITSWLVLSIADTLASLGGRRFGNPTKHGKSILGATIFLSTSIVISFIMKQFYSYDLNFTNLIFACCVTCIAEFFSNKIKIDDNFLIPIVFCLSYNIDLILTI